MNRYLWATVFAAFFLAGCLGGRNVPQPMFATEVYDNTNDVVFDHAQKTLIFNGAVPYPQEEAPKATNPAGEELEFEDRFPYPRLFVWEPGGGVAEVGNGGGDLLFSGTLLQADDGSLALSSISGAVRVNLDTGATTSFGPGKDLLHQVVRTLEGETLAVQNNTVVRWNSELGLALEALSAPDAIRDSARLAPTSNGEYFVVASRPEEEEGSLIEAWLLDGATTEPVNSLFLGGSSVYNAAITNDNRYVTVSAEIMTVWDIESGEVTSIDSVNATYSVFVLENGLIMTSGRDEKKTFGDPDAVNMTRFWDPDTLEEVASLEGMRVKAMTPMEEGQVAFVVELDDPEAMRGEGATKYRVEVWELDTITN